MGALGKPDGPISIHAPREGSDDLDTVAEDFLHDFYPRSPRGERPLHAQDRRLQADFYPRSPRGERPAAAVVTAGDGAISIHAPREGSDGCDGALLPPVHEFLSTLPARGATAVHRQLQGAGGISIHAPREGSDRQTCPS